MYLAYLTLASGLLISLVGEFYSIIGLMTIFSANPISVAIMGVALGIGKIVGTVWLKQNWNIAPIYVKIYLLIAIFILMCITSIGIFGLLSKAHNDRSLVSGDSQAKVAIFDEKIKTARENIDTNRKALKQMDDAVEQTMGRSTSEQGADKAVQIRRSQQKERTRLLADIEAEQKKISQLMEDRAPLAAETRKIEAEVGPIKYLAALIYGNNPDTNLLESAVTWVIIIIVCVFDPLAVIMLLAAQMTFAQIRKNQKNTKPVIEAQPEVNTPVAKEQVVVEKEELVDNNDSKVYQPEKYPYLDEGFKYPEGWTNGSPLIGKLTEAPTVDTQPLQNTVPLEVVEKPPVPISQREESRFVRTKVFPRVNQESLFVQNEEQNESNLWTSTVFNVNITEEINSKKIAQEQYEKRIQEYVDAVKSARISMAEVPEDILVIVKSRV